MSKIPITEFPKYLQDAAKKVDVDGDGAISGQEIAVMIEDMNHMKKLNKTLSRAMMIFGIICVLLVGSTFGASITAARLSKDFVVDPSTGFATAKGHDTTVMRTTEALKSFDAQLASMPNEDLVHLRDIMTENMHFLVKGFIRDPATNDLIIYVEGGFLRYNQDGLVEASGPHFDLIDKRIPKAVDGSRNLAGGASHIRMSQCFENA